MFLLLLAALVVSVIVAVSAVTAGEVANNLPTRSKRYVRTFVVVIFANTVAWIIYVIVDQTINAATGFVELPTLIAMDLVELLLFYLIGVLVIFRFRRGVRRSLRTSGLAMLPMLMLGLCFVRFHIFSYCASGQPSDARCKAILNFF